MSIAEASLTIEQLADDIRRENERRSEFARLLAATDRVIGWLEECNLRGETGVKAPLHARIGRELAVLPGPCREVLSQSTRVEAVLDSVYEVQERLFRWRDPGREVETGPDYTAADLVRWAGTCRWLESFEQGLLRSLVPQVWFADLEALHALKVVFLRDNVRWRAYGDWPARLERMRVRLEAGGGE